ncbi:16S rRNA (cytosine(1402)-N(4))-methyltransferase RsmH [Corynebacterium mendelii]|uniref:16S rRNA (cytosine(1402)-N(4))-methyltransferase RsmH n=1 Tax=Corynebacterium mendelii TaxID=2765362 RepID=UPI003626A985
MTITGTDQHGRFGHQPVMMDRVTELLRPAVESRGDKAVIVDCTLGAGGHSEHFLSVFPETRLIGVDRDTRALDAARARLTGFGSRFTGVATRFDEVGDCLAALLADGGDIPEPVRLADSCGVSAFLFDLGVSSMQLDQPERGFSYAVNAPLDMRMDTTQEFTAADIVNTFSHGEIAKILKDYGDERFAGKIASLIVQQRTQEPIRDTETLVEIIYRAIPAPARRTGGHPAKRTFQALRVAVNSELDSIARALPAAMDMLAPGGRIVVMSYQSHEDRLVKKLFRQATASRQPAGLPVDLPGLAPEFRLLTRGADTATEKEIAANPRAKPARVRAIEKLPDT